MKHVLEPLVAEELAKLEFELVELRVGGTRLRPVVDIRIDRLDLQKVQVGDCERASRAIESRLDAVPEMVANRYVLEVSSPGMERPLRTSAQFSRFVGRRASVKSPRFAASGGRAEVEIVGVLGEGADERIVVRDLQGTEYSMALADVDEARLAFHWKP